jgi:hypothetical protein
LLQISRSQLPLPLETLIRHSSHWDYSASLESVFSPIRSNKKRATQWSPVSFWIDTRKMNDELSLELASSAVSLSVYRLSAREAPKNTVLMHGIAKVLEIHVRNRQIVFDRLNRGWERTKRPDLLNWHLVWFSVKVLRVISLRRKTDDE